ncbi:MAG: hypothetical protein AMXMBFR61_16070 [Fimbriimonadales bacterium]
MLLASYGSGKVHPAPARLRITGGGGGTMKLPKPKRDKPSAIRKVIEEARELDLKGALKRTLKDLEKAGNEPMQRDIPKDRED